MAADQISSWVTVWGWGREAGLSPSKWCSIKNALLYFYCQIELTKWSFRWPFKRLPIRYNGKSLEDKYTNFIIFMFDWIPNPSLCLRLVPLKCHVCCMMNVCISTDAMHIMHWTDFYLPNPYCSVLFLYCCVINWIVTFIFVCSACSLNKTTGI